ncbi:MAG: PCRF domain-containing protein [Gemmatimonadetes bacterium]|nr:PCRF domain-containing protein [Gemmatimonadota bacterium]
MLSEAAELAADAAGRLALLETPSEALEAAGVACRVTAGAGGAEAQDWAVMLHSMYRRWAASRGLNHEATAELLVVRGVAGAELLGEHDVHRLARFSPHDPRRRMQTSFASVAVTPLESQRPEREMALPASEVRVETFRGSGPGGQHRNTRDTAVRAVHVPTGLAAVCDSAKVLAGDLDQFIRAWATRGG